MDDTTIAVELAREALVVAAKLALPALLVCLVAGGLAALLQSASQMQDSSLSFVPKLVAVGAAVFLLMPWFFSVMADYAVRTIAGMGAGL